MDRDRCSIWVGFDPREAAAYAVCRSSIIRNLTLPIPVHGVVLDDLRRDGLYTRPIEYRDGQLYDPISEAPMSTEFAISRFFVPHLAGSGWALFMDCDMLVRSSLVRLFEKADPKYAVYCVKHNHVPTSIVKMDGQTQTKYPRKNWSSFALFNCDHPANKRLSLKTLNKLPGRDLHAFSWLHDDEIGELGPEWNYLVDETKADVKPEVLHFTKGGPWMAGYEDVDYADQWNEALRNWAR
jgi:lipopolysaccharide biosynthesis glycosyltransferase